MKMIAGLIAIAVAATAASQAVAGCGKCGPADKAHKNDGGAACAGSVCAAGAVKVEAKAAIPTVTVEALAAMIGASTPVSILDARSGKWDDGRRIPGAKSLNAGSKDDEIAAMLPSKDALVVTYCTNTKCQASPMLAKRLREMGYKNVIELPVGIDGWEAAGQKVEKTEKK
jgi:rhodanese-related sulfurtransferase